MPTETSSNSVAISGTASGSSPVIQVTTNRGASVAATGSSSWSATVPLANGNNRLTIQATDSAGYVTTIEKVVRYNPSGSVGVSGMGESAGSVQKWDTIQCTFNVDNSAATNTQFPYTATPVSGLAWVDGCTVNGVFWNTANPGVTYTRPAFVYQNYDRQQKSSQEWLNPTGTPTWMVRFAPPSTGTWNYYVTVAEAKGTATSSTRSFTVTTPTDGNNHGPVERAPSDTRYLEYADGTPFLGVGHGIGFDRKNLSYDADSKMSTMGNGANQQFFRYWMAGNIWGSAWSALGERSSAATATCRPPG